MIRANCPDSRCEPSGQLRCAWAFQDCISGSHPLELRRRSLNCYDQEDISKGDILKWDFAMKFAPAIPIFAVKLALDTSILTALPRGSGDVRVRFCVRFQAVKVSIFGGFPVGNPTKKATSQSSSKGEFLCPSTVRRGSEYG